MITKINHIAIAVQRLSDHIPFYRDVLGLEFRGVETIAEQKVRVALFGVGEVQIELLEPLSADSPISKFLKTKGDGLHHIAYQSDDIEKELIRLRSKNMRLLDPQARPGAHGSKIAFLHPGSTGRVLSEICQPAEGLEDKK